MGLKQEEWKVTLVCFDNFYYRPIFAVRMMPLMTCLREHSCEVLSSVLFSKNTRVWQ